MQRNFIPLSVKPYLDQKFIVSGDNGCLYFYDFVSRNTIREKRRESSASSNEEVANPIKSPEEGLHLVKTIKVMKGEDSENKFNKIKITKTLTND